MAFICGTLGMFVHFCEWWTEHMLKLGAPRTNGIHILTLRGITLHFKAMLVTGTGISIDGEGIFM